MLSARGSIELFNRFVFVSLFYKNRRSFFSTGLDRTVQSFCFPFLVLKNRRRLKKKKKVINPGVDPHSCLFAFHQTTALCPEPESFGRRSVPSEKYSIFEYHFWVCDQGYQVHSVTRSSTMHSRARRALLHGKLRGGTLGDD